MINILYTISAIRKTGPNRVLENIIKSLDNNEYNVYLLSYLDDDNNQSISYLKKLGVKVISLKLKNKIDIVKKGVALLNSIIEEYRIDIVHSHGILPDISNAKSIAPKKITTIHNNMFEDYILTFGNFKGSIFIKWHLYYLKKFDSVYCCSHTSYNKLKKYLSNTFCIQNGVDVNEPLKEIRKQIRKKYNIGDNDIVYLYAGKISKLKRVEKLAELFDKSLKNNEYLFIIGGKCGFEEKYLKNKNIIFLDFQNNILDYFSSADVYVSFSSSEGFSISLIEALANNLLLLISDIPSHKECFDIDNDYYIGEYFNENNFVLKKKKVLDYLMSGQYIESRKFQRKYLSSSSMSLKYSKEYEKNVKKG